MSHFFQGLGDGPTQRKVVNYFFGAGNNGAIGVNGFHLGDRFLAHRIDRFLTLDGGPDRADEGETVREMLHIAAIRYFQRLERNQKRMADLLQYVFGRDAPEFGFTRAQLGVERLFDRPFLFTPMLLQLDASGTGGFTFDLNSAEMFTPGFFTWRVMMGFAGSAQEHELWEEIALKPAVSTPKVFQLATANGIPFVTFDQANAAAVLANLDFPNFLKNQMQGYADRGLEITTPTQLVDFQGAQVAGFTARNAQTGGAAHIIFIFVSSVPLTPGPMDGSTTGVSRGEPQDPGPGFWGDFTREGGTDCPDPVTVSNGNMFHQFQDFFVPTLGGPLVLVRTYNSQSDVLGPFGHGWTHNYNVSIRLDGDTALYVNESGGTETLRRNGNEFVSLLAGGLRLRQERADFVLRFRHGLEQRFDSAGKLQSLSDRNGNTIRFSYDGQGNLTTATGPLGRTLSYSHDGQNRITAVEDFTGRRWSYAYDGDNNLVRSVDPLGNSTTYTYYSNTFNNHNLKTIADPEGHELTFVYYVNDKVFKTINRVGDERRYFYLPFRNETQTINERGLRTSFIYDQSGRVTRQILANGNVVSRLFDSQGLPVSVAYETGTLRIERDAQGNLSAMTNQLGQRTEFSFDPVFSRLTALRDPAGNTWRFEYDTRGNAVRFVDPHGNETGATYDDLGRLLTQTGPLGSTRSYRYEAGGLRKVIVDELGNDLTVEYDALFRPTVLTNAASAELRFAYDELDRMTSATDTLGRGVEMAYDRVGRLVQLTDANARVTRYGYDGLDRLIEVTDPLGQRTRYDFRSAECLCNSAGGIVSARTAAGSEWRRTYNPLGQLTERHDPDGRIARMHYNPLGQPVAVEREDGAAVRLEYDALGRISARVFPDGFRETFGYDETGKLVSASNPHVTYTLDYTAAGTLLSVLDSRFPEPIRYEYDSARRLTRIIDPQGAITAYEYDAGSRVTLIRSPGGREIRFLYNPDGRRQGARLSNGVRATYGYDAAVAVGMPVARHPPHRSVRER